MTGSVNISGTHEMNGFTLGGTGSVYMMYWTNNTGKAVSVKVSVSAIIVHNCDDYYNVKTCINNTTNDRYSGVVMDFNAESEYYYTSSTITVTVPSGQNLLIFNHNDIRTTWTVTYN